MNLETSSDEEDDSSTSTVLSRHEGLRQLERMMLPSSTPGTLDDTEAASDVDWGHVRPAHTDFLGRGETEITESAARQNIRDHTPSEGGAEAQHDPNKANHFIVALSRYNIGVLSNLDLQEASDVEEDSNSCTEASYDEEPNEDNTIESDTETFPRGD